MSYHVLLCGIAGQARGDVSFNKFCGASWKGVAYKKADQVVSEEPKCKI